MATRPSSPPCGHPLGWDDPSGCVPTFEAPSKVSREEAPTKGAPRADVTASSGLLSTTKVHVEDSGGTGPPRRPDPRLAAVRRVVERAGRPAQRRRLPRRRLRPPRLRSQRQALDGLRLRHPRRRPATASARDARPARRHARRLLDGWRRGRALHRRRTAPTGCTASVFAAAVPPYLLKTDDNPDGPLTEDAAAEMTAGLTDDRTSSSTASPRDFFSADGELKVTEDAAPGGPRAGPPGDQDRRAAVHGGLRHAPTSATT